MSGGKIVRKVSRGDKSVTTNTHLLYLYYATTSNTTATTTTATNAVATTATATAANAAVGGRGR